MKRFETIVESDLLSLYTVNTSDTLRSDDEISVSVSEVDVTGHNLSRLWLCDAANARSKSPSGMGIRRLTRAFTQKTRENTCYEAGVGVTCNKWTNIVCRTRGALL